MAITGGAEGTVTAAQPVELARGIVEEKPRHGIVIRVRVTDAEDLPVAGVGVNRGAQSGNCVEVRPSAPPVYRCIWQNCLVRTLELYDETILRSGVPVPLRPRKAIDAPWVINGDGAASAEGTRTFVEL